MFVIRNKIEQKYMSYHIFDCLNELEFSRTFPDKKSAGLYLKEGYYDYTEWEILEVEIKLK